MSSGYNKYLQQHYLQVKNSGKITDETFTEKENLLQKI